MAAFFLCQPALSFYAYGAPILHHIGGLHKFGDGLNNYIISNIYNKGTLPPGMSYFCQ